MQYFLKTNFFIATIVLMLIGMGGCGGGSSDTAESEDAGQEIVQSEDWTEETHGDTVDANYDVVFEEGVVHRLDVTIDASDWEAMLDDMTSLYGTFGQGGMAPPGESDENPIWVPCTIEYNGIKWMKVGIRFKGNSSLSSTWRSGIYKLPLRLDFDEFEDDYPAIYDQRFYGFQKLSFSSGWRDDSLIREKVTADIFRDAGVPAPRTAFYRIYIDYGDGPIYFGLYTMVEIPSKPMLETQFGGEGGNLYKPDGTGATFAVYDEASFDKETNEDEADFSDVRSLYDALHADRSDAAAWRAGLEAIFDVPGFIRWLAVNTVIQNWDTYGVMSHNYYLYNDPESGLLSWIPWDNNEALSEGDGGPRQPLSLELTEVSDSWPLIRYLMDDPEYYDLYVEEVENTVNFVFYPEYMQPTYEDAHDLISPYVVGSDGETPGYTLLSSQAAFEASVDDLDTHVEERYDAATAFASTH